jgi:hypothetical protein
MQCLWDQTQAFDLPAVLTHRLTTLKVGWGIGLKKTTMLRPKHCTKPSLRLVFATQQATANQHAGLDALPIALPFGKHVKQIPQPTQSTLFLHKTT